MCIYRQKKEQKKIFKFMSMIDLNNDRNLLKLISLNKFERIITKKNKIKMKTNKELRK